MTGSGGRTVVVTGASGGIGRAIAEALAAPGVRVVLIGRRREALAAAAGAVAARGADPVVVEADLSTDDGIRRTAEAVAPTGRADVLVHAAGVIRLGRLDAAGWDDLDVQYQLNARAPLLLTKALGPLLASSQGQVVFVNSSAALRAGADNALYAASKAMLTVLANGVRDWLNPLGVRVLSVFPGRTATAMQDQVQAYEGRACDPAALIQPADIAAVVAQALALPRTAEVTDLAIRPMRPPRPL